MRLLFVLMCFLIISCSNNDLQRRSGELKSIEFNNGSKLNFDQNGLLTSIKKTSGDEIEFNYDTQNRISSLINLNTGLNGAFVYDSSGKISSLNSRILNYNSSDQTYTESALTTVESESTSQSITSVSYLHRYTEANSINEVLKFQYIEASEIIDLINNTSTSIENEIYRWEAQIENNNIERLIINDLIRTEYEFTSLTNEALQNSNNLKEVIAFIERDNDFKINNSLMLTLLLSQNSPEKFQAYGPEGGIYSYQLNNLGKIDNVILQITSSNVNEGLPFNYAQYEYY